MRYTFTLSSDSSTAARSLLTLEMPGIPSRRTLIFRIIESQKKSNTPKLRVLDFWNMWLQFGFGPNKSVLFEDGNGHFDLQFTRFGKIQDQRNRLAVFDRLFQLRKHNVITVLVHHNGVVSGGFDLLKGRRFPV